MLALEHNATGSHNEDKASVQAQDRFGIKLQTIDAPIQQAVCIQHITAHTDLITQTRYWTCRNQLTLISFALDVILMCCVSVSVVVDTATATATSGQMLPYIKVFQAVRYTKPDPTT